MERERSLCPLLRFFSSVLFCFDFRLLCFADLRPLLLRCVPGGVSCTSTTAA